MVADNQDTPATAAGGLVEGEVSVGVKAAPGSVPDGTAKPATIRKLPDGVSEARPEGTVLGRESILANKDKPRRRLYVQAFGGIVCLQEMKSIERDAYENALVLRGPEGKQIVTTANIRAKLCCRMIIDESGNRIFTDEDADLLGQLPAAEMDRLWSAAQALSGVSNEDVKVLAGNSEGSRGDSSASA